MQDVSGVTIVLPPNRTMMFFEPTAEYSSLAVEHRISSSTACFAADCASMSARPLSCSSAFRGASSDLNCCSNAECSESSAIANMAANKERRSVGTWVDTRIASPTNSVVVRTAAVVQLQSSDRLPSGRLESARSGRKTLALYFDLSCFACGGTEEIVLPKVS